jgi:hypothetical protein
VLQKKYLWDLGRVGYSPGRRAKIFPGNTDISKEILMKNNAHEVYF